MPVTPVVPVLPVLPVIPVMPGITPRLVPDAEESRRLLEEELAKPAYVEAQPNIFERMINAFVRSIAELLDGMGGADAGLGTVILALGAALIIVVAVVLIRPRLNPRGRAKEAGVFDDDPRRTAAEHRSRADHFAAKDDWNGAVAEILRAMIRSAEERLVVDDQPGRTATEAAIQLGGSFPALASEVGWLADLFNETHYGSGRATRADYQRAVRIDRQLAAERPARPSEPAGPAAPQ